MASVEFVVRPERVLAVADRLEQAYGRRTLRPGRDPLGELILTILSQNTTDRNSGRAYRALRAAFPSWQAVLEAPVAQVYEAIKPAGLGNVKAPRIQRTLAAILEQRGELTLDFLADLPMEQARAWLLRLDGIGPKTAACVLLFALGMPALPVDTHVHRVSQRLGLIGAKVGAERAHALLEAVVPPARVYAFHVDLIQHGRRICTALRPQCAACPLNELCDYAQGARSV